jgi:hypothetical protein
MCTFMGLSTNQPLRRQRPLELELSFVVIIVLSSVYVAYEILAEPAGGHPFGHWLGIVGTVLMVMTETLYSLRKRTNLLNWAGPVRIWLSFHVFTGLVGPFLVLMHTGLAFRGLAGVSFVLTVIVVASGFLGRYLYTAIPRRLSGAASTHREIAEEARQLRASIEQFQQEKPSRVQAAIASLEEPMRQTSASRALLGRWYYQRRYRRQVRGALRRLEGLEEGQRSELRELLERQEALARQMATLDAARQYMRLWHMAHIPLGLTLFFSVAVHIVATLYFRAGIFGIG